MSLIDLFKEYHSQTVEKEYPASARLLGYWLIGEFNKAHWAEELSFSERDLCRLTGLPASTIHSAIKYLCDRRIIKTWRKQKTGRTIFKLLIGQSTNGAQPMHEPCTTGATIEQPASVPIERAREDVKTVDVKTLEEKKGAGANGSELDRFLTDWAAGNGVARSDWLDRQLAALLDKHGCPAMTAALERANRKANNTQGGFSLEFFEKQLAELCQSPKSAPKGGERVGKISGVATYKNVAFDDSKPLW